MEQPDPSSPTGLDRPGVEATIERTLEDGLRSLQRTADDLMHEIASEVWRAAGGDKDQARSRILEEISRDQALRSLIAHSDERFQALAVRTARLEDTLAGIADAVRSVQERLDGRAGGSSLDGSAADQLRAQLAEVSRRFGDALETLAERDQAIVDAVRARVLEHGEPITQETTRISRAMESYVQHGVEAIGRLAGTIEAHLNAVATREEDPAVAVRAAVEEQLGGVSEQLQLLYDRVAIETSTVGEALADHTRATDERIRALGEYLHLLNERIDVAARDQGDRLDRTVDARVMGLARMMRSDAEALRDVFARTAQEHGERLTAAAAEQQARLEALALEQSGRIADAGREQAASIARATAEQSQALAAFAREQEERMLLAAEQQEQRLGASADARFGRLIDALEDRLVSISGTVSGIEGRLEERIERLDDRTDTALAGIARLIRSDNETLARQIVADQESSKQALRSMKELQANLPSEVIDMVEQRFASLAESIERSNEMLAKRIDRMAVAIGQQHETDIQVVIDRMGDAMHALASLGRATSREPRIELD